MSMRLRHGIPVNLNIDVDENGQCIRFDGWTESIVFRADGPCTVFWSKEDFDNDVSGQIIPGEEPAFELRIDASVRNVWLRGRGSTVTVRITYTTRGF